MRPQALAERVRPKDCAGALRIAYGQPSGLTVSKLAIARDRAADTAADLGQLRRGMRSVAPASTVRIVPVMPLALVLEDKNT